MDITHVLSEIAGALVGQFELSNVLDQVVNTSMRTLNAEVCSIFLVDREKEPGVLTMMAGSGFAKHVVGKAQYQIGEAFTGFVAQREKGLNVRSREQLETLQSDKSNRVWRGK